MDVDAIRINFTDDQLLIMNLCLAFMMFSIALDIKSSDFKRIISFPKATVVGLTSQLILLPIFTLILIQVMNPYPSIALGMILVAVCPGGNISNFATHHAGGNAALSITLTSIITLSAVFVTPFSFQLWSSFFPELQSLLSKIQLRFLDMVVIIFQLIIVPLFIGMFLNYRFPVFTMKIKRAAKNISLLIFAGFIIASVAGNMEIVKKYLRIVLLLVFFHNTIALIIGYYFARLNKLSIRDAKAISLETGVQNAGLGLVLIFNFFPELGGMILVAAWWGVYDLISSFILSSWWARKAP